MTYYCFPGYSYNELKTELKKHKEQRIEVIWEKHWYKTVFDDGDIFQKKYQCNIMTNVFCENCNDINDINVSPVFISYDDFMEQFDDIGLSEVLSYLDYIKFLLKYDEAEIIFKKNSKYIQHDFLFELLKQFSVNNKIYDLTRKYGLRNVHSQK